VVICVIEDLQVTRRELLKASFRTGVEAGFHGGSPNHVTNKRKAPTTRAARKLKPREIRFLRSRSTKQRNRNVKLRSNAKKLRALA